MKRVVFWGTGNTAGNYVNRIRELSEQFEIVAFTDSHCARGGAKFMGGLSAHSAADDSTIRH